MKNYQLARTIIPLSGQVEWDVRLNAQGVESLTIAPVSPHINYVKSRNAFLDSHEYNVRALKHDIADTFYESVLSPRMRGWQPIITEHMFDAHESTYEYGVSRIDSKRYGKMFKLLVPVWLEDMKRADGTWKKLRFVLRLSAPSTSRVGATDISLYNDIKTNEGTYDINTYSQMVITLDADSDDELSRYFFNYLTHVKLNSDFMYMSFLNNRASICGLHTSSASHVVKDVKSVLMNMTHRERPVMEQNHMMTQLFAQNDMICKQLFNFAFLFDIDDILPKNVVNEMWYNAFNVTATVHVMDDVNQSNDDTRLEMRDFFFNYDNLNKMLIEQPDVANNLMTGKQGELTQNIQYSRTDNTFDYLKDNYFIDFYNVNKLVANDIYMSLEEHDNVPFTLYDGMSPIITWRANDGQHTHYSTATLFNTTNVYDNDFSMAKNQTNWCRWYVIKKDELSTMMSNNAYFAEYTTTDNKLAWYNGVKYNIEKYDVEYDDNVPMRICGAFIIDENVSELMYRVHNHGNNYIITLYVPSSSVTNGTVENKSYFDLTIGRAMTFDFFFKYIQLFENYDENSQPTALPVFKLTENKQLENIIYKNVTKIANVSEYLDENASQLKRLNAFFKNIYKPSIIMFNKSIVSKKFTSPVEQSREITYSKSDDFNKYILRYDGRMTPFFINTHVKNNYVNNEWFFKLIASAKDIQSYVNMTTTHYIPQFKSTTYYPLVAVPLNERDEIKYTQMIRANAIKNMHVNILSNDFDKSNLSFIVKNDNKTFVHDVMMTPNTEYTFKIADDFNMNNLLNIRATLFDVDDSDIETLSLVNDVSLQSDDDENTLKQTIKNLAIEKLDAFNFLQDISYEFYDANSNVHYNDYKDMSNFVTNDKTSYCIFTFIAYVTNNYEINTRVQQLDATRETLAWNDIVVTQNEKTYHVRPAFMNCKMNFDVNASDPLKFYVFNAKCQLKRNGSTFVVDDEIKLSHVTCEINQMINNAPQYVEENTSIIRYDVENKYEFEFVKTSALAFDNDAFTKRYYYQFRTHEKDAQYIKRCIEMKMSRNNINCAFDMNLSFVYNEQLMLDNKIKAFSSNYNYYPRLNYVTENASNEHVYANVINEIFDETNNSQNQKIRIASNECEMKYFDDSLIYALPRVEYVTCEAKNVDDLNDYFQHAFFNTIKTRLMKNAPSVQIDSTYDTSEQYYYEMFMCAIIDKYQYTYVTSNDDKTFIIKYELK